MDLKTMEKNQRVQMSGVGCEHLVVQEERKARGVFEKQKRGSEMQWESKKRMTICERLIDNFFELEGNGQWVKQKLNDGI